MDVERHRGRHCPGRGHPGRPPQQLPRHLANVNGTLFFQANDGTTGPELWKAVALPPPDTPPPDTPPPATTPPTTTGPGPQLIPDNRFALPGKKHIRANTRRGRLRLFFNLPGPGRLEAKQASGASTRLSSATPTAAQSRRLIRPASTEVPAAGRVSLVIAPTKRGLARLKRKLKRLAGQGKSGVAKLKVAIQFTFRPTGGVARSKTGTYTLKLKGKKKKRKV